MSEGDGRETKGQDRNTSSTVCMLACLCFANKELEKHKHTYRYQCIYMMRCGGKC